MVISADDDGQEEAESGPAGTRPSQHYQKEIGPAPSGFDPEWAKFVLALKGAENRSSLFDRIGVIVALMASFAGAITGLYSMAMLQSDRASRQAQQDFDNQVSLATIYFERLSGTDFCDRLEEARLFGQAALIASGLSPDDGAEQATWSATSNGTQAFARLIVRDAADRGRTCPGQIGDITPAPNQVRNAPPPAPNTTSSYQLQQQAARIERPRSERFIIFIQYPAGEGGRDRAARLRDVIDGDPNFAAPAIDAVEAVPGSDQIRIYHRDDEAVARRLAEVAGLQRATIVNLEAAYSNLPQRTMEVWLSQ